MLAGALGRLPSTCVGSPADEAKTHCQNNIDSRDLSIYKFSLASTEAHACGMFDWMARGFDNDDIDIGLASAISVDFSVSPVIVAS